jgi:hypothetical protein
MPEETALVDYLTPPEIAALGSVGITVEGTWFHWPRVGGGPEMLCVSFLDVEGAPTARREAGWAVELATPKSGDRERYDAVKKMFWPDGTP